MMITRILNQFCRWVADVVGKKENIDWDKFK